MVGGGEREGCVGRAEDAARISLRSWTGGQLSSFGSRCPGMAAVSGFDLLPDVVKTVVVTAARCVIHGSWLGMGSIGSKFSAACCSTGIFIGIKTRRDRVRPWRVDNH